MSPCTLLLLTIAAATPAPCLADSSCPAGHESCRASLDTNAADDLVAMMQVPARASSRSVQSENEKEDEDDEEADLQEEREDDEDEEAAQEAMGEAWQKSYPAPLNMTDVPREMLLEKNTDMPAPWLQAKFSDFTPLCSHNTYIYGDQYGRSVHEESVYAALEMGYRCLELDVYVDGSDKDDNSVDQQTVYVYHPSKMNFYGQTNRVDFIKFIQAIRTWCENFEKKHGSSWKLPLILNIDRKKSHAEKKLKKQLEDEFGSRLIKNGGLRYDTKMDKLATQGKRRVIVRSTKSGTKGKYQDIVAMTSSLTKSYNVGPKNAGIDVWGNSQTFAATYTNLKKITEKRKEGKFIRFFPHALHSGSENFRPYWLFVARANMICINMQGYCEQECNIVNMTDGSIDFSNKNPVNPCNCQRDVAEGLERVFHDFGYDGYIHYDSLSVSGWEALRGNSEFQYSSEDGATRRRRCAMWLKPRKGANYGHLTAAPKFDFGYSGC